MARRDIYWFRVPRGGRVIIYGRAWRAWPWSTWVKVRLPDRGAA